MTVCDGQQQSASSGRIESEIRYQTNFGRVAICGRLLNALLRRFNLTVSRCRQHRAALWALLVL